MSGTAVHPSTGTFTRKKPGLFVSLLFCPMAALAAPTGGVVTSGTAAIEQSGSVTNINQSTQKAAINWQGFGIQAGETVNFNQPNASAITLNRVIGNERSVIDGALNANGRVFLVNSAGVLFGKGSSVNVGGLLASTRDISDADFNAGNFVFKGDGNGSVINLGTITAKDGGYVALLGGSVSNQGVIAATKGMVAMGAGNRITLNFNGDSLLNVTLDEGALDALVENRQAVYADGGTVLLTAKAADELLGAQVNNSGIVRARTIDDLTGKIELYAHGGTTNVDGTLDASAPGGGDGGFVETSGAVVNVADSAFVTTKAVQGKTGTWLIDPNDFTVAASGGNMTGAAVAAALANNNYEIRTATMGTAGGHGDIHVNDAITWDGNTRLTLDAERDININNAITANGAGGGLTLNYGGDYNIRTKASYAGAVLDASGKPVAQQDTSGGVYGSVTFNNSANANGLTINGDTYTLIHSMAQLDALDGWNAANGTGTAVAVTGNYALAKDLDASGTTYTQALLGTSTALPFSGTLTGLGHTVNHLTINAPYSRFQNTGLVGAGQNLVLRDIGIVDANVASGGYISGATGILAGQIATGSIYNAYSTGQVNGGISSGSGLVGILSNGILSYAYSTANILNGTGLAGQVRAVEVSHVHATGDSNGAGLIGAAYMSNVSLAYATGDVTGSSLSTGLGGLIGSFTTSTETLFFLKDSFATGNVSGGTNLGGLVGIVNRTGDPYASAQVTISNVYSTGNVTAGYSNTYQTSNAIGGLIGLLDLDGMHDDVSISDAHATGNITLSEDHGGTGYVGGLVGSMYARYATLTNTSYTGNIDAPSGRFIGGLVGFLSASQSATISGSHASGNITGRSEVGGLIGRSTGQGFESQGTTITSSYFNGRVTASEGVVGGLFGDVDNAHIGSDVFYNQNGASGPIGFAASYGQVIDNSQRLTSTQFSDIAHYLDGTIDQVLAGRAAQAARDQALADRATLAANLGSAQVAAAQQQSGDLAQLAGLPGQPQAGQIAPPPDIASHIAFANDARYSSSIQSIEIDGGGAEQDKDAARNQQ